MSPSAGKTTLVVGIDFGTTFSGVSWLICKPDSPPAQPEIISLWPTSADNRQNNSDGQKVPSKMYFDENGELIITIEWFKLLLLNDKDLQSHLQDSAHLNDAKQLLDKIGKTAVQVVGEYLKVMWRHTLNQISNAKGQELINGMPIHVVLTVPAIWTDYARKRMREAAALAGIFEHRVAGQTILPFISEPEAAAVATIPELENRGDLQVGDSFVVVDAGGGTVDIISYELNELEPLSVSECVEGEGALCGDTFLNKEFEALLKSYIGKVAWDKMNCAEIRRLMNNEWEHGIKEAFNGEPDYYTVELPSRAQCVTLKLSSDELRPIFDKIVSQISRLYQLVILVGGFGRSPYLLNYLRKELDSGLTVL
ncbi:actin-like ATPase domain-containing protein [Nemania serpens]|nr:actin-like ATPase domain-containing protein [Nemania serpens]